MSDGVDLANKASCSDEMMRTQVAACTRLLNMTGILHYAGHVSARVPGEDQLYIQTRDQSRAQVTPDSILRVDFDGNVIEGDGRPPSELVIHTAIYRARPDVGAVVHNHMELAAAFTIVKGVDIQLVDFHAVRWAGGIPTSRVVGHVKTEADGAHLVQVLGDANAVLLRAHGMVLVAESAPGILVDTLHFADNANAQKLALSLDGELEPLTQAELVRANKYFDRDHHIGKMWNYFAGEGKKRGAIPDDWDVLL